LKNHEQSYLNYDFAHELKEFTFITSLIYAPKTALLRLARGGVSAGTLNRDLAVVRRILILAAHARRDEQGKTRPETAPLIRPLPNQNARRPYPLTHEEQ